MKSMREFNNEITRFRNLPSWNEIVAMVQEVPPLPSTISEALELVQNGPDVNLRRLTAILEKDAGLTSKILKVANSALFCKSGQVSNLLTATNIIGLKTLKGILISTSLKEIFTPNTDFLKHSWKKSAICCKLLRELCASSTLYDPEDLSTLGVVHCIGEIILGSHEKFRPVTIKAVEITKDENEIPTFTLEDMIGFKPSLVSALLMKKWNFPEHLCLHALHRDSPIDLLDWNSSKLLSHALFQTVSLLSEILIFGVSKESLSYRFTVASSKKFPLPRTLDLIEEDIRELINCQEFEL